MIKTIVSASLIFATMSLAPAEAARRQFWWLDTQPAYQIDDNFYDENFDEQENYAQDQFNQEQYDLYKNRKLKKKKPVFDQTYYEPKVEAPVYKSKPKPKPQPVLKQAAPKPAIKPTKLTPTTVPIKKRFETATPVKAISCIKGAGIVSEYGFSTVTQKSCVGSTFVYGASRSGKNFEIEVSSASGELTAVKKL